MAKSCTGFPQVRNSRGEKVNSRLFSNLLTYTKDRQEAARIYLVTKSSEFIANWNPKLRMDENGEPTIGSLLSKTNLRDYVDNHKILRKLNNDIGHFHKESNRPKLYLNNEQNYRNLMQRAIQFNTQSDFRDSYVYEIQKVSDTESHRIFLNPVIRVRNKMNSVTADNMAYNFKLNERLMEILSSWGISVGALTELERRRGIAGVADFSQAKDAATGLTEMIRLADGIRGEQALPEEFAHFAIEAMGNNPLINRLINNLADNNLVGEILGEDYETYNTLYKGDQAKLAKEAAGKLLAKHLLQQEPVASSPYRNLLQRVIDAVKRFFKGLNASSIEKAMLKADSNFASLAGDILTGQMDEAINISNISSSEAFYSTKERVDRDSQVLQEIIKTEVKRYDIYNKRNPNSPVTTEQRLLIDRLELELQENNAVEGVYLYLSNGLTELEKIDSKLKSLRDDPSATLAQRSAILRDVRNYLYSYKRITNNVRQALREEEAINRYGERVKIALENFSSLLQDLEVDYSKLTMPLFVDFVKPFMGEAIEVPFGKYKGKIMTAEQLIQTAERDISFFDRWLDSMADSSDYMLKIMDQAVKQAKERARLDTINIQKKLQAAGVKLEQAGVKDMEWMFEKDSRGNKSGNYISEINYAKYRENMKNMFKDLRKKYGAQPVGEQAAEYNRERVAWLRDNTDIIDGVRRPKMSIYQNPEFAKLNKAQKEFYNTVMGIKSELDALLPEGYTFLNNAVKIRKDLFERIKSSSSVGAGAKQFWEHLKDQVIRRADDTDFGYRSTILDFENREVQMLPIYYTKMKKGESANDISTDVVGTLTAYAAMANDFYQMNKIIDVLEVGRDLMRERQIAQRLGGKPLVEKFTAMGRSVENVLTRKGDETRFMGRLNDFFDMQVYGRYIKDEGTIGDTQLDIAKIANLVNRMTSVGTLAVNILAGISNVATGKVMMRIEAFAGEFFKEKDVLIADKNYAKELPQFLAQMGSRVKTNKMSLWAELFNTMQEFEQEVREINFDRKTWFSRLFGTSALFFLNNAGEHWMQTRTSLALANAYKMKSPDGKIVSLWDAMEVVYIDKNNKKQGAKLQLKKGYTKEDGSEFTEQDIIKFSRKSAAVNQRMHGIYNKADRAAFQKLAVGRLGFMFRKWIKSSLNRRFKSATYNYDLEAWTEGYYLTSGKFMLSLMKDVAKLQFDIASKWSQLTNTEKANMRRALVELAHFLTIAAILGLVEWSGDKDRPWLVKMTEYQLRRLYTEIGALTPTPAMLWEGLRILKSPAAGINTAEKALGLLDLMNPWNYEVFNGEDAVLKQGPYEGKSKAQRAFLKSPLAPMYNTVLRGIYIEDQIPFFKQ